MSELLALAEQDVPQGYKKTEVGVIPEDWKALSLNELAFFGGGTTPARKFHDRYFVSGTHCWVKTLDLNNSFIWNTEEKLTDTALVESSLKKHKAGAVLVAMYGGFNQIGRTGLIKVDAAINQALVAILPKVEQLSSEYLLFNLNFNVDYWKGVASSSRKDPNITSNDVKNYCLPVPPLAEQTAIATALSDVDALITELEKLIAKKQAIKTATMQQLLTGRTRLPQFALRDDGTPKGYKASELGEIPEDWDLSDIGSNTTWLSGGTPNRNNLSFWSGTIPWISGSTLKSFEISTSDQCITEDAIVAGSKKANVGFVLLLVRGSALHNEIRAGLVVTPVAFNQDVKALVPNKNIDPKYLTFFLLGMEADLLKLVSSAGNSAGVLDTELVKGFKFFLPSTLEQTAIADILSDMDSDINSLQQRLSKTRQIKQGMMQELLTGKTRLKV